MSENILPNKPDQLAKPEKISLPPEGALKVLADEKKRMETKPTDLDALEIMRQKHKAISFLAKFERAKQGDKQGFAIGEKVAAPFVIVDVYDDQRLIDKSKIGLLVERIDTRMADTFVIDVEPEEYKMCQENKGMEFNGVVEVTGPGSYKISNMFEYPAQALELEFSKPVNPDNISEMPLGDKVILEGQVSDLRTIEYSSFKAANEKKPRPTLALLTLQTPQGENISVQIDPNVQLEASSDLENIKGKVPEVGDVVRVNARVGSNRIINPDLSAIKASPQANKYYNQLMADKEKLSTTPETQALAKRKQAPKTALSKRLMAEEEPQPKVLVADWCRSTYLISPNESREQQYQELRQEISQQLKQVETNITSRDYAVVRQIIGEIIKKEVTVAERQKLNQLVESMPDKQQPLMIWQRYEAKEINKMFETNIDQMTYQEFFTFAKDSVATPYAIKPLSQRGDPSYLYRLMDNLKRPAQEQEELISLAIESRWQYFAKLRNLKLSYDHDKEWSDKYMLEQSLKYLAYLQTVSATQRLFDYSDQMVANENLQADPSTSFVTSAISAIRQALYMTEEQPELLPVFKKNLDKLKTMEQTLSKLQATDADAKRHYAMDVDNLQKIIKIIEQENNPAPKKLKK